MNKQIWLLISSGGGGCVCYEHALSPPSFALRPLSPIYPPTNPHTQPLPPTHPHIYAHTASHPSTHTHPHPHVMYLICICRYVLIFSIDTFLFLKNMPLMYEIKNWFEWRVQVCSSKIKNKIKKDNTAEFSLCSGLSLCLCINLFVWLIWLRIESQTKGLVNCAIVLLHTYIWYLQ